MADQDFTINIRTTADTAGIERVKAALISVGAQVQSINAAGGGGEAPGGLLDKAAAKIEHGIFRSAVHAVGIAVVYEIVGALREAGEQLEKTSDELSKQGELLVKNAQLYGEQAKFATSQADVIKIGNSAMKDVAETHKRVVELQQQELGLAAKFSDYVTESLDIGIGDVGTYEKARQANLAIAAQNEEIARQSQYYDILAARTTEARHAAQSYEETVAELTSRMKEQQALAETHFANKDAQSYLVAATNAENYRKQLEALKATHDKLTEKTEKYIGGADPQVKAILANEKAMFEARAAGRGRDADLFEQSALRFRAGATPAQLEDVAKIYSGKEVVNALKELGRGQREQIDLWK